MKSYTKLRNLFGSLSQNTSATNLTLGDQLINDSHRRYLEKYFFNEASTTITTISQQQEYDLPYDYSLLKTGTLTIGSLKWTPVEILTRREWDILNTMQLYADIPNNYFIYNRKFALFPIPSTTGNTITFNYKKRVPDLTLADYTTGAISVTNNTKIVTGTGTSFLTNYLPTAGTVLHLNLWLQIPAPKGSSSWYQVYSIESNTQLTLINNYQDGTTTGASYVIGQLPLLLEDYHDILVFDALCTYFSTIVDNKGKYQEFEARRKEVEARMNEYVNSRSLNVNLARPKIGRNPNLYQINIG